MLFMVLVLYCERHSVESRASHTFNHLVKRSYSFLLHLVKNKREYKEFKMIKNVKVTQKPKNNRRIIKHIMLWWWVVPSSISDRPVSMAALVWVVSQEWYRMRKDSWKGGIQLFPQLSAQIPVAHIAHASCSEYKEPRLPSGLWKLSELPPPPVFIFFCHGLFPGIQYLGLTWQWEMVPCVGRVNKNKFDKGSTEHSQHGQSIAGSLNHGGKVREVTDLDNRARLSSVNSDRVSESPR